MSTRKIMNAKDLSTNELIYFRGHAKATYMSDGITTVEDAINSSQSDWNETDTTSKSYIANKPNIRQDGAGTIKIGSSLQNTCFYGNSIFDVLHSERIYADNTVFEILDTHENELVKFDKNGDGTKFLAGDCTYKSISTAYPIVNHNQSEELATISPNMFHIWGEMSELSILFGEPEDNSVANEYVFQFTSGATTTTLTLPVDLQWTSEPVINPNCTYQVSILNNCATLLEFAPLS